MHSCPCAKNTIINWVTVSSQFSLYFFPLSFSLYKIIKFFIKLQSRKRFQHHWKGKKLCAQRNKGLRNWSLKIQESNAKLSPKPSPVKYIIIGKLTGHRIILLWKWFRTVIIFSCIFYHWCRIFALYRLSYFKSPYIEIGLERLLF